MIDGVKIVPLRQIVDERGKIMHMVKATDEHFIMEAATWLALLEHHGSLDVEFQLEAARCSPSRRAAGSRTWSGAAHG